MLRTDRKDKTAESTSLVSSQSTSNRSSDREVRTADEIPLEDLHLADYRRVKNVGQGSFGVAVLYRKLSDNSLVVLKLINMSELTIAEKDLAMNEVKVFSNLKHPNIISYFGSFVRNNMLHIEMEYADGGTLAQVIAARNAGLEWLPEREIVTNLEQITSAIKYMHGEHILHRDLKTANVFLSQTGAVKIGDFGISKILNTRIHAQTILGTPFYLSPEMCEGREYDMKSDIWALGCILGEMCCLEKAFAATNLSELIAKIMTANYTPIPAMYCEGIRSLMDVLLDVNCIRRPTAADILQTWIPILYDQLQQREIEEDAQAAKAAQLDASMLSESRPDDRSIVYNLDSKAIQPLALPANIKIRSMSCSATRFLAVTFNGSVFSCDAGGEPVRIESLKDRVIIKALAGDGFSIFLANNGVLLSCGDNRFGCLGLGDITYSSDPCPIDHLTGVQTVAAGPQHVVAACSGAHLYSWGSCESGALGLGTGQLQSNTPCLIDSHHLENQVVQEVVCSVKCTLILLESGDVLACGENTYNRLSFGAMVEDSMVLKRITGLDKAVLQMAASDWITAFVIEGGYILTLGRNLEGQCGVGHLNAVEKPTIVGRLSDKYVTKVKCYKSYCVAFTDENVLYIWGRTPKLTLAGCTGELQLNPTEILALYSSSEQQAEDIYLQFSDILPLGNQIFAQIATNTPLA